MRWNGAISTVWIVIAGSAGCLNGCTPTPPRALAAADMREDLRQLARELPRHHANAFHHLSRERFAAMVDSLDHSIDEHVDFDHFYAGLDRIVNAVGDAHTYVQFPNDNANLPLDVQHFGTEWRVVSVERGSERALGSRMVKIDDVPIDHAVEILRGFTPSDENATLSPARIDGFLTTGMILHGAGITKERSRARYTLVNDSGEEFVLDVSALPPRNVSWVPAWKETPLYRRQPGNPFWCEWLPESRTVYCSFRGYSGLGSKNRTLFALLDEEKPDKLIVDMRLNGGGDYKVGLLELIQPIARRADVNRRGHLFVLVGPNTFSAAMSNAAQFRTHTAATLVGELVGEKPNSYQEPREFTLRHSHLVVRYSTRFYRFVDRGANEVRPDLEVVPTWEEVKAGRDPVLESILAQRASRGAPNYDPVAPDPVAAARPLRGHVFSELPSRPDDRHRRGRPDSSNTFTVP